MSEALADVREGFSKKEIKMAIGVASDPRYKQGNYTGAVNAIEKIKKGLSKHPQVAAVLKRQNEKLDQEDEPFVKDLIKNLRKGSATHSKQADDLEKAVKEETELDEDKSSAVYDFDRLIKDGGLDKRDFRKAKNLYVSGKLMDLRKHIYNLDTSPLEAIMDVIAKNDPKAFMKMYPKSKKGEYMSSIAYAHKEEVELDDIKEGFFSKEYEKGQYKNGDEKPFVDAIKKAGGKNIDVQKPTNRNPMLTIEFDGDVKRAQKEVDKVGDGTEDIDENLDEAKEVLSRFKDDKLKKSIMNLATQKGLKVKEVGDKLEVSGNARKVMDLTLAVQKHDVKIEQNIMSAYTAAITKQLGVR